MAKKPNTKKAGAAKSGRKTIVPDTLPTAEVVENYARLLLSKRKIADLLGISEDTVHRHFAANIAKIRAENAGMIGGLMMQKAKAGYWPALKWLSQQILGHSTKVQMEGETTTPPQFDPEYLNRMRKAGLIFNQLQREKIAEAARKDAELLGDT